MKPLFTYGLGIEKNVISWSSLYKDSAYEENWPTNVEAFTEQEETVAEALAESNNAITVKVLDDVGIKEACTFMRDSLELQVDEEKKMIDEDTELYKKELLSSLGLGYLTEGVNVKEMLENYQVFAQGGEKYKLSSLKIIENKEKEKIYENSELKEQIFSSETDYIMNRMLKGVVQSGTGKAAQTNGIDVSGKTGTSDNYRDNWFVGMTPEYVCAVWYGMENGERMQNDAVVAFRETINQLPADSKINYQVPETVVEREHCEKTGLLAVEHCENIQTGYYKENELPSVCGE